MIMLFGSLPPATLALTGIGAWLIPGMPVISKRAPENLVVRGSENCSSIFAGAAPLAPSAGVEASSLGCAWAAPVSNRPAPKVAAMTRCLR